MVRVFETEDGSVVSCGENAKENDMLVKAAKQRDIWFHLDGQPSAHVLLSVTSKSGPSRQSLHDAQQVCKYFSARQANASRIIYVEAKAVSNAKENKTGSVELKKQPSKVTVVYDQSAMDRLLSSKK